MITVSHERAAGRPGACAGIDPRARAMFSADRESFAAARRDRRRERATGRAAAPSTEIVTTIVMTTKEKLTT